MNDQLTTLIHRWENTSCQRFEQAKSVVDDSVQKLFLENSAMIYFNCANELKAVLASASPEITSTPSPVNHQKANSAIANVVRKVPIVICYIPRLNHKPI